VLLNGEDGEDGGGFGDSFGGDGQGLEVYFLSSDHCVHRVIGHSSAAQEGKDAAGWGLIAGVDECA